MKKILFLSILLSLLFVSHTLAATLDVKVNGTTINATLSNVTNTDIYQLLVQTDDFTSDTYTGNPGNSVPAFDQTKKQSATATVKKPDNLTWSLPGYKENTTYYIRILDIPPAGINNKPAYAVPTVSVKTQAAAIPFDALTTSLDGNNILVSGKINTTQVPNFDPKKFSATLIYTATIPVTGDTTLKDTFGPFPSSTQKDGTVCDPAQAPCINSDGTYYWYLKNLRPSTVYYFQQTVTSDGYTKVDVINHFNSSVGSTVAAGSAAEQSEQAQRGYTLLSKGFPGLSFLPDPDLCAQERAAGQAPKFCDINDVLNYALRLLIGLAGVMLVFRLMYEGYNYMTTDVPWVQANSKAGFLAALGGLLLALTSYIILNTINPKLVNESINVQQLAIGIDGDSNVPTVFVSTGKMPGGVSCPGSGKSGAISSIAQSYRGKVTYSQTNKSATAQSDGYARLDCSSFVNTVLKCAGYVPGTDFINEGTVSIFGSAEQVNMSSGYKITGNDVFINNKKLNPGDLIGWTPSQGGGNGHAIIYIGNGTFMDSHGGASGRKPGNAIGTYSASQIQQLYGSSNAKSIKEVKRIPSL